MYSDAILSQGIYDASSECRVVLSTVEVRDLKVLARIGVNDDELDRVQQLTTTVVLRIRPVEEDDLSATIDYREIVSIAEFIGRDHIGLIETFALRLGQACLRRSAVLTADVTVEKASALANGVAATRIVLSKGLAGQDNGH